MEWLLQAGIYFVVVGLASYFFGETGSKIASGCLIVGSLLIIASLPVLCWLFLRFVIPVL